MAMTMRSRARLLLVAAAALLACAVAPVVAQGAPPANDDFASATVLASTLPANESGTLVGATSESGEPRHIPDVGGGKTVWYRWKPAVDVTVAVATCGSPAYSGVAVYGQGPVGSLGPRLGTQSGCLNGTSSIVHAQGGKDYWIAVENVTLGGDAGDYVLALEVAGTLAGQVLNESSQPVADHCVRVLDPVTGTAAISVQTGADGRWSVELPPDEYLVRFVGCVAGGPFAREYWQNAANVGAAATIDLMPGQVKTGVDAHLEPAASVAGTLTDPAGDPVANACVQIYDHDRPDEEVASTSTDATGHYQLTNLAAGPYKLHFDPGCIMSSDLKDEYYDDAETFAAATVVTLAVGQNRGGIGAVLGDGGSISGTVRNGGGAGIGDICVSATPAGGGPDVGTQTGPNGGYTIAGLDPGSYVLAFNDCSTSEYASEYFDDSPDLAGADPVAVSHEQDVTAIDATLQRNGSISGLLTGPADEPLANICVAALGAGGTEVANAITGLDGGYSISGLAPGQYRVHFVDCGSGAFVDEYYSDAATLATATALTVTAGQATAGINAKLASAGAIAGSVTAPGGGPATDVCVSALSSDGAELSLGGTDPDGRYVITHLKPGLYKVIFRDCDPSGGALATEFYDDSATFTGAANVQVQEGLQTDDIDAALAAGGSISGTVTAEGSAPAADVCVSAFPVADAVYPVVSAVTAADGSYVLGGLATGAYKVHFDGFCTLDQLAEEFFSNAATFAAATPVSVTAPNDHGGINAELAATQPPTVTILSGPSGPTADATPTFGFQRTGGGGVECSIDTGSASYGPCSKALAHTPASNLADGGYTFRVRVSNSAGEQTATRSFSVDRTAPSVAVTGGPAGPTNVVRPTFTFNAEAGASVQCSIDAGAADYGSCSAAAAHQPGADLGQGSYTFRIRATDAVGNSSVATRTFSIDTTKPAITITGGPSGPANLPRPTFTFNPEAGATVRCSIDSGTPAFGACSGPGDQHRPAADLGQGAQTFRVEATDAAGNVETATRSFTVDTIAPDTAITAGPGEGATITTAAASISFNAPGDPGASFECKLDGAGYAPCTSPRNLTSLTNGPHTFSVRATDAAGNVDPTPATRTFSVDTSDHTPPETTITSGPADGSTITTGSTSFGFQSNEPGSSFECRLDGGGFTPCTSPRALSGLADGSHTFQVQATDANGNLDPTPATRTFTVAIDATAPDTVIDSGPNGTITTNSASFSFHATEPGSTFECRLDSGGFASCASPRTLSGLAEGAHTFSVRATDAAGNVDASPATRTFTVATPQPPPPDTSACDAARADLTGAQAALKKAKKAMKKAKSSAKKRKAKIKVIRAQETVKAAEGAVAAVC